MIMAPNALIPTSRFTGTGGPLVKLNHRCSDDHRSTEQVFRGISRWPDIDQLLAEKAKQLIKQHGVQNFALAGGTLRPDGLPSFGRPSVAAFKAVRQVVEAYGRFRYVDNAGRQWGMLVADGSAETKSWRAIGVTLDPFPVSMLDPIQRQQCIRRLESRLNQLRGGRFRFDRDPDAKRSRVSVALARATCIDTAMRLIPLLMKSADIQGGSRVSLDYDDLAIEVWGSNKIDWPDEHKQPVFDAIAGLSSLRVQSLSLPKTGWSPRPLQHSPAVSQVRRRHGRSLPIRLHPLFTSFFNTWFDRCSTGGIVKFRTS